MHAEPIRRQLHRVEIAGHVRFLTFSCYDRLPLFKNDAIKQAFVDRLAAVCHQQKAALLAWVVMPEHVHLLILPQASEVSMTRFTHALKRPFAESVLRRWRQLNAPILQRISHQNGHRFWQTGGGFDRNIFSEAELNEKVDYIHANPVRRGLTSSPENYEWSSVRFYSGFSHARLACDRLPE